MHDAIVLTVYAFGVSYLAVRIPPPRARRGAERGNGGSWRSAARRSLPAGERGRPGYHYEYHASFVHTFRAQIVSLIASGVFKTFPMLRFVLEEGGFAWLPALMWRLDRTWRRMGAETTRLDEAPSATVRKHFWFTTQPVDEAERPQQFMEMLGHLEQIGMLDRMMFATDYPHCNFDSPEKALPDLLAGEPKERIFQRNAQALYRFATT